MAQPTIRATPGSDPRLLIVDRTDRLRLLAAACALTLLGGACDPGERAPPPAPGVVASAPTGAGSGPETRRPTDRPNIVLIIGDDLGYADYGFAGAAVHTPHLDGLAEGGASFTQAYSTASICAPALQSLLTGLHPMQSRLRLEELRAAGMRRDRYSRTLDFQTLPRMLAERGYASFQAGKINDLLHETAGFTHGVQPVPDPSNWFFQGAHVGRPPAGIRPVLEFIDQHEHVPFFIWYAPMLPHLPHDAPERFQDLYRDRDLSAPARAYYANISRFDETVGELVGHLDARGLRDRTLIVYLADNGWDQAPHATLFNGFIDGPRGKGTLHELGLRTPILINWPGQVPPQQRTRELVSAVDVFPTLLDYAGARQLEDRAGTSLRPTIERGAKWKRKAIFGSYEHCATRCRQPGGAGREVVDDRAGVALFVRSARWHYIWYAADDDALYDVTRDPSETVDLSQSRPKLVSRLRDSIDSWRERMRAVTLRGEPSGHLRR